MPACMAFNRWYVPSTFPPDRVAYRGTATQFPILLIISIMDVQLCMGLIGALIDLCCYVAILASTIQCSISRFTFTYHAGPFHLEYEAFLSATKHHFRLDP
ncbi:hypothetical protein BDV27DRAFT_161472 [Aspergillus caelatus]|uniref:Uncharacterized protein n=2 Tax=Aspergillus subgen. Circumdati TaxID=2720871 RepID=A0A5N6ZST0_9EURO|nr:uncharacterized protein BDV27DRAFT_161472 [Aspergillus caelatus]KAE8360651.1 hypothetical protein BDV27DRAFT_161472 [Aspergillus caelatus]